MVIEIRELDEDVVEVNFESGIYPKSEVLIMLALALFELKDPDETFSEAIAKARSAIDDNLG